MNLPLYPKYRPSGFEWIGDVPEHWKVGRLRTTTENVIDQTNQKSNWEVYIALEHVESWTGRIHEYDSDVVFESQVKKFRCNDVLFGKLRPYLAKIARPSTNGVCVGEFLVLRPRNDELMPNYLEYLLRSQPMIDLINASTFGAKMPRTDWQFIRELLHSLPPLSEQMSISDFLDRKTEKIKTLIDKNQMLVERLKEKRAALITCTVIRGLPPDAARAAGLDPYPKLKPSGVGWIGCVPKHWKVKRFRMTTENIVDQTTGKSDLEIYIALEHVESWTGRIRECDSNIACDGQVKKFRSNDVLFGKLRPYLAKITRPNTNGVCVGELLVLRPRNDELTPNYLEYVLRLKPLIDLISASTFGAKMPRADWQLISGFMHPLPPLSEQISISNFLDQETDKIDDLIVNIETSIKRLREYRSATIAAAVTGKIDTRTKDMPESGSSNGSP